jgi:16S rRNA processing protein RimM
VRLGGGAPTPHTLIRRMPGKRICVGEITGAHGIRGEVKLKSFTADPLAVRNYAPLESEDGTGRFVIEELHPAKGHFVARLSGVEDRASAERLAHVRLFVARDVMPAPAADEFYHADLIGLRAVTTTGEEIATVTAVHDFGAGAILELQRKGGEAGGATIMVPFTDAFVPHVDIAAGRIVVAPPADSARGESVRPRRPRRRAP